MVCGKPSRASRIANVIIYFVCFLVILITTIPFLNVVAMSLGDPVKVVANRIFLIPYGAHLTAYKHVIDTPGFWKAYEVTIFVTLVGTAINIFLTVLTAYPLSRPGYCLRRPIMLLITFTMFISGGMIPTFLVVMNVGLYDSIWAMILPSAISTYNLIVCRTFLEGLPESMIESARLDGANEVRILASVIVPLSKPIIAVLVLFYAVAHWNSYFTPLLYITSAEKQPLTVYMYKVLILAEGGTGVSAGSESDYLMALHQTKYAIIVLTVLPIICVYPFLQKYFVQGVMVGAIKG